MDAKNQQDRAKMVEEAVSRMCRLGMMPQVITKFRKQGTVLKSETAGILYDLNDEEKKAVADWEEKSGGIVYAAILSNMVFGRCLALLYISAEEEEWELDKDEHLTWFEIKKNDAKRIVKRMGWESLADFLNNYTWDDTEILYQIADSCGMIVADWIEREVEDGRN